MKRATTLIAAVVLLTGQGRGAEPDTYLRGGPLAGVPLPLYMTQHGEEPGHPGCVPELAAQGEAVSDMGTEYREWGPQGLAPERELYPGSVEHWRAYMFKYMPIRSFFDRQSQIRNWATPDIPGSSRGDIEQYAEPVYWVPRHAPVRDTGLRNRPVSVVRWKVGRPVFALDLGELPVSMYAVRVIAAVETAALRTFRRPVFLRCRVNDGLGGEASEYKLRIGYCDEFYSVAEFHFNAPERRRYKADLWVDEGSEVDLLVRNISLDDVLAGATRRAVKQRVTLAADPDRPAPTVPSYTAEQRLARDAALWNYLPPPNHQGSGNSFRQASYNAILHPDVQLGAETMDRDQVNELHGAWVPPTGGRSAFSDDPADWDLFLTNERLGLVYTVDDMIHYRPLPDPFPYKDDGTGVYFADPTSEEQGKVFAEIGIEVMHRIRHYPEIARTGARLWRERGDVDAAHDGAIALARYAYLFPSVTSARYLCNASRDPGAYGRNLYNRRIETAAMWMTHYANYLDAPKWYDGLFDFIQGNQALADSVARFVPWVKTPEDVCKLIEVYLVQMTAKRVLRYHYHTDPMVIADLAAILGPAEVTDPWMEFLFSRTFIYPMPPGGIQNLMICGCDREGAKYIGSTYYAQGSGAAPVARSLQRFKDMGVLPDRYDLTDAVRYPKPLAKCYWHMDIIMGGRDFPRIGDVGGPDKAPGYTLGGVKQAALDGWLWSRDPTFAWVIRNEVGRDGFPGTDGEWNEVEMAAAGVERAPWLESRSRQVYNWFGALETGVAYDDFSARRGAYVRIGAGIGHQHSDTMDLQFYAHGLPMTIDGGQRPGYTTPPDRMSRVHNVVEVNGSSHRANSWVRTLSDAEGARYMCVEGAPPPGATLFRRCVALLDVRTPPPNSYIFDVFRVSGGDVHTHCFHGPLSDEVTSNAELEGVVEGTPGADYLAPFGRSGESWLAGDAPELLETTWRYAREVPGTGRGEQEMMGRGFDPESPRKHTRLHLLGAEGLRVMQADAVCHKWDYRYTCQMAQRRGENLESAFTALYEPYAGDPFIAQRALVPIADNENDALRAVAVRITTTTGQTDLCFSDGRPDKTRTAGDVTVSGEFASVSTDGGALRAAALTGGTLLRTADVEIRPAQREYGARVTAVDYLTRQITLDRPWPASLSGGIFEIGSPERTTSYTSASVRGNAITVTRGADYFRSIVTDVDPEQGRVTCQISPALGALGGLTSGFVASNDEMTRWWRADVLGDAEFRLKGQPVSAADFGRGGALRLWEYGVGDSVRMSTWAAVRRVGERVYSVSGNTDVTIGFKALGLEASADGANWEAADLQRRGEWVSVPVPAADLGTGGLRVRVRR
ncbi:MAG: hypothetical protein PVH68_06140 [Armatimonadota bacterium]